MGGLVLKLGPKERVLINGVVVENGDRRTRLSILTKDANILRLRDALHPSEAKTPVRRVCYILQLILSGNVEESEGRQQVLGGISQLKEALIDSESLDILHVTQELVADSKFYPALKKVRALLPKEDLLLAT
ncbi:MAG: flagellar biosynthesis repressor FlbT [Pseudomonadota bacterium]